MIAGRLIQSIGRKKMRVLGKASASPPGANFYDMTRMSSATNNL